jgi:hypothetical protein
MNSKWNQSLTQIKNKKKMVIANWNQIDTQVELWKTHIHIIHHAPNLGKNQHFSCYNMHYKL